MSDTCAVKSCSNKASGYKALDVGAGATAMIPLCDEHYKEEL